MVILTFFIFINSGKKQLEVPYVFKLPNTDAKFVLTNIRKNTVQGNKIENTNFVENVNYDLYSEFITLECRSRLTNRQTGKLYLGRSSINQNRTKVKGQLSICFDVLIFVIHQISFNESFNSMNYIQPGKYFHRLVVAGTWPSYSSSRALTVFGPVRIPIPRF